MITFIFILSIYYYILNHYECASIQLNRNQNTPNLLSKLQSNDSRSVKVIGPGINTDIIVNSLDDTKQGIEYLMDEPTNNVIWVISKEEPFDGILKIRIFLNKNINFYKDLLVHLNLLIKKSGLEQYCDDMINKEMKESNQTEKITKLYCLSRYISRDLIPVQSDRDNELLVEKHGIETKEILKYVIYFFEIMVNNDHGGPMGDFKNTISTENRKKLIDRFIYFII